MSLYLYSSLHAQRSLEQGSLRTGKNWTPSRVSRWRLHCRCCLRSDCLVVLWYAKQGLHQTCDVLNARSGFRFSPGLGFPCPLFPGNHLPTQPPPEPHHDEDDDDDDRPLEL